MNKKGQAAAMSGLQKLLLFIAVLIAVIGLLVLIIAKLGPASDKELCRASVIAKYATKKAKADLFESNIALQCFSQDLKITSEGVIKAGKDREYGPVVNFEKSPSFGETRDQMVINNINKAKKAVADQMFDCWDQFLKGNIDFWKRGDRCVVCAQINFEPDWLDVSGSNIDPINKDFLIDMGKFLNEEKINRKQTYADALGGDFPPYMTIPARYTNMVVFKSVTQSRWALMTAAIGTGTATGCALGAAAGAPFAGVGALPGAAAGCIGGFIGSVTGALISPDAQIPVLMVGPAGEITQGCERMF